MVDNSITLQELLVEDDMYWEFIISLTIVNHKNYRNFYLSKYGHILKN